MWRRRHGPPEVEPRFRQRRAGSSAKNAVEDSITARQHAPQDAVPPKIAMDQADRGMRPARMRMIVAIVPRNSPTLSWAIPMAIGREETALIVAA